MLGDAAWHAIGRGFVCSPSFVADMLGLRARMRGRGVLMIQGMTAIRRTGGEFFFFLFSFLLLLPWSMRGMGWEGLSQRVIFLVSE